MRELDLSSACVSKRWLRVLACGGAAESLALPCAIPKETQKLGALIHVRKSQRRKYGKLSRVLVVDAHVVRSYLVFVLLVASIHVNVFVVMLSLSNVFVLCVCVRVCVFLSFFLVCAQFETSY